MKGLFRFCSQFKSSQKQVYDVIVIGGGPGGYVSAIRGSQLGLKVACIEKRGRLGGTCLNVGCIPSKTLLHCSEVYEQTIHEATSFGIHIDGSVDVNFDEVRTLKEKVINGLSQGIEHLFKKNGVDYYEGFGSFLPEEEEGYCVNVDLNEAKDGEEELQILGNSIVIASGSCIKEHPQLPPIDEELIMSSDGALELSTIPSRLCVLGVGAIGLELGSVYQRYGSEVTVLYYKNDKEFAHYLDKDLRKPFLQSLKKQGMKFKFDSDILDYEIIESEEEGKQIKISIENKKKKKEEEEIFDCVLVSTGRDSFFDGLNMEELDIELTENKQKIQVDEYLQTNKKGIYAIGDVIEGPMLAHKAEHEGVAVMEYIQAQHDIHPHHPDEFLIPAVIYTTPEVATIGYSEEQLKKVKGKDNVISGSFQFIANSRARAVQKDKGIVKIIAEKDTDLIKGMQILGPDASEMIMEGVIAVSQNLTVKELYDSCHPHPAFCEAIKEAALDCHGIAIHK